MSPNIDKKFTIYNLSQESYPAIEEKNCFVDHLLKLDHARPL